MQRFPQVLVTGAVRMPVSLATVDGLVTEGAPTELVARLVESESGAVAADRLVARRHGDGLATPYWPFRAVVDAPGAAALSGRRYLALFLANDAAGAGCGLDAADVALDLHGLPPPGGRFLSGEYIGRSARRL